jgi:Gly-Xaa carboxypeptidase
VQLEHINTHGLLYTYQGSDAALKPIVFTAHQDVVPVDASSEARWTHAPFSGLIDEKLGLVWGRGSSDDKGEQQRVAQAFWC